MGLKVQKENHSWLSSNLGKEINLYVYGHYGFGILLFPAMTDDPAEYEEESLIEALSPYIEKGKCKVFSICSVNEESWLNKDKTPEEKSQRHLEYNNFIIEEAVPFIFGECGGPVPIITCGAGLGAYHAANTYFRRPDIFQGTIAASGVYNIEQLTGGYFDSNCYFNSPIHYLPNLNDNYWLSFLKSKHHIYIMSGKGKGETPHNAIQLGEILAMKGIPHHVDIWGEEWGHNWDSWKAMISHVIETKF
jgi:esterase/lipase superfamily enzyme